MKIRLYPGSGSQTPERPAATLVLDTRRDQAVRLPDQVGRSARFFLERVETPDPDLEHRLIDTLTRESVSILRAAASTRGGIRTRGEYRSSEPYGTPTYWQAAIGRIPREVGLRYDPDDYNQALQTMETAVRAGAPQPARPANCPEREPGPTSSSIQDLIGQLFGVGRLAFRQMGSSPEPPAQSEPLEAPPLDRDDLARQAERDPELARAIHHLRAALAKPAFRSTVLLALEAFARAAEGAGEESEST